MPFPEGHRFGGGVWAGRWTQTGPDTFDGRYHFPEPETLQLEPLSTCKRHRLMLPEEAVLENI